MAGSTCCQPWTRMVPSWAYGATGPEVEQRDLSAAVGRGPGRRHSARGGSQRGYPRGRGSGPAGRPAAPQISPWSRSKRRGHDRHGVRSCSGSRRQAGAGSITGGARGLEPIGEASRLEALPTREHGSRGAQNNDRLLVSEDGSVWLFADGGTVVERWRRERAHEREAGSRGRRAQRHTAWSCAASGRLTRGSGQTVLPRIASTARPAAWPSP